MAYDRDIAEELVRCEYPDAASADSSNMEDTHAGSTEGISAGRCSENWLGIEIEI